MVCKYIKCFSEEKYNELLNTGFDFLYSQNGVYYFNNTLKLANIFNKKTNFSKNELEFTNTLNF